MLQALKAIVVLGLVVTIIASVLGAFIPQIPPGQAITVVSALVGGIILATIVVLLAMSAELVPSRRYTGWVRSITGPNGRYLFFVLLLAWTGAMLFMPVLAQVVQPGLNGAPSPALGGLAFVGLLAGVFLFMGFVWSVISE